MRRQQLPHCGWAAAEGVNCFRFVGIQIRQPEGGTNHQINHLSGMMARRSGLLLSHCLHLTWQTMWTVFGSRVDLTSNTGLRGN